MSQSHPPETIEDLIDGSLEWEEMREMMSSFKNPNRFLTYRDILQEKVNWDDPIVLPYAEQLYVVAKPDDRWVIKCECSEEFCEHDENWKLDSLINVRDSEAELRELYPKGMHADPEWQELREYICPGCQSLLEVNAVLPGYPPINEFEPDIETFYRDWLDEPIPSVD